MMQRRGILITLEGIDGTGKSTHARLLVNHLRRQGYRTAPTREPGGTAAGEAIREILLTTRGKNLSPVTELVLMYAARAQHIDEVIRPALLRGQIVVSDRYNDASFAYQGFGRKLGVETVHGFDKIVCGEIQPDLTLLLDLNPEAALRRARGRRGGRSRFEAAGLGFQARVRAGYLEMARRNPSRVVVVNAGRTRREVTAEIRSIVDGWLAARRRSLRGLKQVSRG